MMQEYHHLESHGSCRGSTSLRGANRSRNSGNGGANHRVVLELLQGILEAVRTGPNLASADIESTGLETYRLTTGIYAPPLNTRPGFGVSLTIKDADHALSIASAANAKLPGWNWRAFTCGLLENTGVSAWIAVRGMGFCECRPGCHFGMPLVARNNQLRTGRLQTEQ
jgi:hypothetical protein